uniref:Mannosyltransferase n=2 Tax=Physcomitrium patens TaxID=3218 RepID=A0A2K1JQW6_PHYPA|nr:hypothetical protein PHYPA_016305 [Physcomitrium patens]
MAHILLSLFSSSLFIFGVVVCRSSEIPSGCGWRFSSFLVGLLRFSLLLVGLRSAKLRIQYFFLPLCCSVAMIVLPFFAVVRRSSMHSSKWQLGIILIVFSVEGLQWHHIDWAQLRAVVPLNIILCY